MFVLLIVKFYSLDKSIDFNICNKFYPEIDV